jgi:hypothetical protein
VQEFRSEEGVSFGKLFFRMRMRKTLKHAIEMQTKLQDVLAKDYDKSKKLAYKHGLEEEKGPLKRASKKVMTIEINQARDLKRNAPDFNPKLMQPFFHYEFYSFEYSSAVADGNCPNFLF